MNLFRRMATTFLASLTNPKTYLGAFNQSVGAVLVYFLVMSGLLSLITASWLYFYFRPQFMGNLTVLKTELDESFPPDRQLQFTGNELVVNEVSSDGTIATATTALKIKSPAVLPKLFGFGPHQVHSWQQTWPEHLAIFVPTEVQSPSSYLEENTTSSLVVVDPTTSFIYDGEMQWRQSDLKGSEIPMGTLTKQTVSSWLTEWHQKISSWLESHAHYIWPLVILTTYIGLSLLLIWNSLLVYLITKVFGFDLSYGQSLKLGAYVLVVAYLINQITRLIYPWLPIDMQNLSFWVIMAYLIFTLRNHLPRTRGVLK